MSTTTAQDDDRKTVAQLKAEIAHERRLTAEALASNPVRQRSLLELTDMGRAVLARGLRPDASFTMNATDRKKRELLELTELGRAALKQQDKKDRA